MSSLKRYQKNPKELLGYALQMYRSKKIITIIVEGPNDKRFLSQWIGKDSNARFEGLEGKALVEEIYKESLTKTFESFKFTCYFADVDYDFVLGKSLLIDKFFVYNAYLDDLKVTQFNDLETFLINTNALEKLLANHDIETSASISFRVDLEKASRDIGKLRVADIILQKKEKLQNSILNSLDISTIHVPKSLTIDEKRLKALMPRWSNYPHFVDNLIELSEKVDKDNPAKWSLSRGHDITEIIALYMDSIGKKGFSKEKVELLLRSGCELNEYNTSPMGCKIKIFNEDFKIFNM